MRKDRVVQDTYWLVTIRKPDGETSYRASYGRSEQQAVALLRIEEGTGLEIAAEPSPEMQWHIFEPVKGRNFGTTEEPLYSMKDHFFKGGNLGAELNGRRFTIEPRLYAEERIVGEGDDERIHVGIAHVTCMEDPDWHHDVELESLDEGHLVDRMNGEIVVLEATLRNAPVSTPAP